MSQGASPRSIQRNLATLRQFFRLLVDDDILPSNPANGIPRPKVWKTLPEYLEVKDIEAMLQWIDANPGRWAVRDRAIVLTLFASGIRSAELVNLKLDDVFLDQGFLKIWNGKGGRDGIAPLNQPAIDALAAYLQSSAPADGKER